MPLAEQTVSLNLGGSIDQKDDEKVSDQKSMNQLFDWVWNKLKRLDKRFGTERLPTTVLSDFPSPLAIGNSPIPSGTYAHGDQLLLQNKGVLYTYIETDSKWKFVGHQYPVEIDQQTAASNQQSILWPNMGKIGNVSVYTYVEQNQNPTDGFSLAVQILKCSVFDELTQSYISHDITVETRSPGFYQICYPQVVTFSARCYLVWLSTDVGASTGEIHIAEVNLTTGAVGSVTNLKTDAKRENSVTLGDPNSSQQGSIDWVYTNKVGVGERAFLTYMNASNQGVVFSILNTGVVDSTMGSLTFAATPIRGFGIHYNTTLDRLFIGYQISTSYQTKAKVASFTTSAIASVTDITLANNSANIHAITFCNDPVNTSQVYAIWDVFITDYVASIRIFPSELCYAIISATAVISSVTPWGRCVSIAAKPISDTLRNTVYIPVNQKSEIQDTLFLADLKRGKAEDAMFAQGKWSYRNNNSGLSPYVPATISLGNNLYTFLSMRKARANDLSFQNLGLNILLNPYVIDVPRNTINLAPEYSSSEVFINNGTHFTGGYMGYYDGAQFCEHSFFLSPEYMESKQFATDERVTVAVTQIGDGSHNEIITVTFPGAAGMLAGPKFWTFETTIHPYYVWYKIGGVGTDPMHPGSVGIEVDLTGNETGYEVALKTFNAIMAVPAISLNPSFSSVFPIAHGGFITLANAINGAVADPTSTNYQVTPTNGLYVPAGHYQYCAVWTWCDINGQVMRSAPSVAIDFESTADQPVTLSLYVPPITNRTVSDCKIEIYRTLVGPTPNFFRIKSIQLSPSWDTSYSTISILDNSRDAVISTQQELYTNGGILDNAQIPALKSISTYKNRVIASGMNPNEFFYSKTATNDQAIEFSEVLMVSTDQDGEEITGHGDLDDKLVIFKTKKIVYYAGDGANDLGENQTFSLPVKVSSDVGCVAQKTVQVVPSGLLFKSQMGIQSLDRGTNVTYPGIAVKDYNDFTISKAVVLKDSKQVREIRFVLKDTPFTIVYNYLYGLWTIFSNYGGTDGCLWQGVFTRCDEDGFVYVEDSTSFVDQEGVTAQSYNPIVQTTWLKLKNVQDFQRVWRVSILGDLKSPHTLEFSIQYDYQETTANTDLYSFDSSNISGTGFDDGLYQPQIHLKRQKCQAIRVSMEVVPAVISPGTEECLTLTDMGFECGVKNGLNKVSAGKKL